MKALTNDVHQLAEQLRQQQQHLGLRFWSVMACPECYRPIGYAFWDGVPHWDSGCSCTKLAGPVPYTWADVALHYILHPAPVLWGFDSTPAADADLVQVARASLPQGAEGMLKIVISVAPELPRLPINALPLTPQQAEKRLAIRHVTFERSGPGKPWLATHITPLPA
jgi:hypothetical protein